MVLECTWNITAPLWKVEEPSDAIVTNTKYTIRRISNFPQDHKYIILGISSYKGNQLILSSHTTLFALGKYQAVHTVQNLRHS